MAFISGSATRVSLTNGDYPTFFRVVPNDGIQAPTDANFMIKRLHAKKVVLVDNQTDYSLALNDAVAKILKAAGVSVHACPDHDHPERLLRSRRNDRL